MRETVGDRARPCRLCQRDPCFPWRHADLSEYWHAFYQDSQFNSWVIDENRLNPADCNCKKVTPIFYIRLSVAKRISVVS